MKKGISIWSFTEPDLRKCFEIAKLFNGEMYCLNVNFPKDSEHVLGYKITRVGYFVDDITMIEYNEGFRPAKYNLGYDKEDLTIDFTAQQAGYISISPLTCDKTNHKHYKVLNE